MKVEHSRLLKFFTEGRNGPNMADTPIIKIQKDYQNPPNVEAEVPGTHKIREPNAESCQDSTAMNSSEVQITGAEFTLSPVITVTKKESTLTKGDLKLQKVTVTEDIAMEETENGGFRESREEESFKRTFRQTSSRTEITSERRIEKRVNEGEIEDREEKTQDEKKSKIPIMRLRQAAEKVKKEREAHKARNQPRRSSIPKLKDANKAVIRDTSLKFEPKIEDEFEKIYEETVDNKQRNIDEKLLAVPLEDPDKVESIFEEIIQSYDEDEQEKHTVSRVSKIPALRRRGEERTSKFGALVDTVKDKTSVTETKLKDGGFKVTSSTIRTKRFSRGNSRDLSREEPQVEVTETIDIKESGDSEVFVRETVSKVPVKPKRTIRNVSKQITRDGRKIDIIEAMQSTGHGYSENIDTVTTVESNTGMRSKKVTSAISKEFISDGQDFDININIEEPKNTHGVETVNVKQFDDGESRVITTRTIRENVKVIPGETRRIVRGVSREINKDTNAIEIIEGTTNGGNTETVTVEEVNDGGGRTITTTTTVRESVKIGTPVITETIVRNISREMNTESLTSEVKDTNNDNTVTIEEITDEATKKIIEKTIERENIKTDSKPVETERFTRDISREMGNIRHRDNKEIVTVKENKEDGSQTVIKKTITRENIKVSSPTKTERIVYSINQQIKDHNVGIRKKKDTNAEKTRTEITNQTTKENLEKKETVNERISSNITADTEEKSNDSKAIIKKETMETEHIVKEGVKEGIPVFSKVTQSFSKGKIQNVEISKTIEWKPAQELRTKSYTRSVSEKVTKKELKGANDWKYEQPTHENTDPSDKPEVTDDIIVNKNKTSKDPVLERKIKDTVKDIASKIAVKKVTEYKSEEQITNTEKNTYTLSKSVDLTLDKDFKVSRHINKQTSLTDPKRKPETITKQDITEYSTEKNNEFISTLVTEKSETEYSTLSKQEQDKEAVTILEGNVNRLKDKITKENVVVSRKETVDGIPKEKSILSKIAMFERLEPTEPEFKKLPIKCKYIRKETYSEQKPKIVDEILKEQSKVDAFGETNRVEIGMNFDEVTYINEPIIVKEYWKTEEGSGENVSTITRVLTEKTAILQTLESSTNEGIEEAKMLPEKINFTRNESKIELAKAIPTPTPTEGKAHQFEVVTTLPEKLDFDPYQTFENTDNIIDENKIKTNNNEFNYEADIGKTKPGKINLNVWKTQVEVNKTLVDKIDIIRGESLEEIQSLPGNVDIKTYESHVQVSNVLPETIDFKKDDTKFQYTKPLPAKIEPEIKEIQFDIVRILPEKIYTNNDDVRSFEAVTSPRKQDSRVHDNKAEFGKAESEKTYEVPIEIAKPLPGKIDFRAKEIELPKILPDKKDYLRPRSYIESVETNQNENGGIKSAPGKLNLNLWKNQVEVNKHFVGKISTNKNKDIEVPKQLPGKLDFKTYDRQIEITKTLPGKVGYSSSDSNIEIGKTDAYSIESHAEVATTLPAKIEFTTVNQFEKIQTLPEIIDISNTESQAEVIETISDGVEFSTSYKKFEPITTLPGKLDFVVENQVQEPGNIIENIEVETTSNQGETYQTLPGAVNFETSKFQVKTITTTQDNAYVSKTENEREVARILPEKISFNTDENKIQVSKPLPGRLDLEAWETNVDFVVGNQVEKPCNVIEKVKVETKFNQGEAYHTLPGTVDIETSEFQVKTITTTQDNAYVSTTENKREVARILPEKIGFSTDENKIQVSKPLPGRLDLKTWETKDDFAVENQVQKPGNIIQKIEVETTSYQGEAYHTLPGAVNFETSELQIKTIIPTQDKAYVSTTENEREVARILPEKIDENKIQISKPLPGRLDLKAWETKIEVNKSSVNKIDIVRSENRNQVAKTLPDKINFSVYENKMQIPNTLLADNYSKKLEMSVESAPTESLSDPELVDEQESNFNNNNNTIINKIKRKMYFMTRGNNIQSSTDKALQNKVPDGEFAEENDYEKKVEKLQAKTYLINEIGYQTINKNKTMKQTIANSNTSNNINEKSIQYTEENREEILIEYDKRTTRKEYELNTDLNTVESNTTIEVNKYVVKEGGTSENEFNFDANRNQNIMSRSAYGAEDFKMPKEDVKRAKSLAELDLGDVINGTVQRMVGRMKSLDFDRRDSVKSEKISLKEMPKKLSVWEKIALFEGKASTTRTESSTIRTKITKKYETPVISEETYLQKIEELTKAKTKYGRMEEMLYLHLANDVEMPVISLGTALLNKRLLPHLVGAAIDLGYRAIDTAYIYDNEKEIGQAIKAKIDDGTVRREELFITSKLWSTFHRPDLVEEACRASLKNLGLDYFDLYLIHNPMSFKEGPDPFPRIATVLQYSEYDYLDAWFGMEGLVSKGLAKSIGVSNFNSQQIQRILDKGKLKPMVNQVECHPYLSQQSLDAFCTERKITLSCFGVLGSKGTPAEYKSSVSPAIDDALVKVMASGLGVSPAQLLVRYQIECGHNVVVKSSSAAHLWDNLQALTFTLDSSQVDALHALNRNKRIFTFAGMGDTHKNYPFLAPF